jgi:hypothetical protein
VGLALFFWWVINSRDMKYSSPLALTLVLFGSLIFTVMARVTLAQSKPEARTAIHSLKPFDASLHRLPPNFAGHDIKLIYAGLARRKERAEKGEFETTQEFEARKLRETSAPISPGLSLDSLLAFDIKNSSGETIYDADAKAMTVAIALGKPMSGTTFLGSMRDFTVESAYEKDSYEGSNAYGAKVQVTRHRGTSFGLAIDNFKDFGMKRYLTSLTRKLGYSADLHKTDAFVIEISMDVETAKRVKSGLTALAVVKLSHPPTFTGTFYSKPTYNKPDEYFVIHNYLSAHLLELWIYDKNTGEVFAKLKTV